VTLATQRGKAISAPSGCVVMRLDERSFFKISFVFLIFVTQKELKSEAPVRFPLKTAKNSCYVFLEDIGFPYISSFFDSNAPFFASNRLDLRPRLTTTPGVTPGGTVWSFSASTET